MEGWGVGGVAVETLDFDISRHLRIVSLASLDLGKAEYIYIPKNTKNIKNIQIIQRIRVLLSGTAESRNLPECESFLLQISTQWAIKL